MTRLSDTQSVILSAAATRANRALLPVPGSVQAKGRVLERSVRALLRRGFAEERPTRRGNEVWRKQEDGRAFGLVATAKGLAAIGIEELEGRQSSDANADHGNPATALMSPTTVTISPGRIARLRKVIAHSRRQ